MRMIIFTHFHSKLFKNDDRVDRYFAYLITTICLLTLLYTLLKPLTGAPMCTVLCTIIVTSYLHQDHTCKYHPYARPILFLSLLISVGIYYDGTNVINRYRYHLYGDSILYDESLVQLDSMILSTFFPLGQIALTLDVNTMIGVTSSIGPYYAEILQLFYVSYYVWGNAIAVCFMYHYYKISLLSSTSSTSSSTIISNNGSINNNDNSNLKDDTLKRGSSTHESWRRILMFLTAWTGTFMLNFLCNLIFPAVSPRIYLKQYYVHEEIHGLFLCDILRAGLKLAAHGTYSAFPSGHCGLSWVAAIVGYRARHIIPRWAYITLSVAAALISLATVVMRYHYFVDFLAAFALVAAGIYWGGFTTDQMYITLLTQQQLVSSSSNMNGTLADDELPSKSLIGKSKVTADAHDDEEEMIELMQTKV